MINDHINLIGITSVDGVDFYDLDEKKLENAKFTKDANTDFDENHFIYTGINCFFEEGGIHRWNLNNEMSSYFKERILIDEDVHD